jgi:hypothetical protein
MGFYGYLQKKLDGFTQRITTKIKEYAHLGIVFKENDKSPHIYIYICQLPSFTSQSRPVSSPAHCRPRVYTKAFGVKIRDLMPALLGSGGGKPKLSGEDMPIHELYSQYPWSDWPEANLEPVIRYLRGSRYLDLPQAWRDVLPHKL